MKPTRLAAFPGLAAPLGLVAPLVIALLVAACSINPVTRRPSFTVMSAAKEREIGAREARKVEQGMGLVDDPALTAYVQEIGARLAKFSPWQDVVYTFYVVDLKEPNAFALPGGHVFVTRGLLAMCNSEDELAGVIGHEIGHVAARHAVQRISTATPLIPIAVATGIAGAITSIVSPTLGNAVGGSGSLAVMAFLAPYSRGQENQADEVGQKIAAQAGYDPSGIAHFLHTLDRYGQARAEAAEREGKKPRSPSFLDTHPTTPSRVARTTERAAELTRAPGTPIAPGRAAFLSRIEGIVVGEDPVQGVFEENVFLHPELSFAMDFPEAWKTQNTRVFVAATSPEKNAAVVLRLAAPGGDPMQAARALAQEVQPSLTEQLESTRIHGLPAVRGTTTLKGNHVDLTWIAHGGNIYLISGVTPRRRGDDFQPSFEKSARSFRPLSAAQVSQVAEARLRVRRARAGEDVESFAKRSGGAWDPQITAIANAVEEGARLQKGQLMKVPIPQPFERRGG